MRWLVTGAGGMLGKDLVDLLRASGDEVTAVDRHQVDVTDAEDARSAAAGHDVVVNCAAWTAVDDAEAHEDAAFAVNAVGAANLARASAAVGARLVQVSTDYVFDGNATEPYREGGFVAPRCAYGRTKAAGEWAVRAECHDHLVVRTAWLYGAEGACFPKTIARVAKELGRLEVVADQWGQPTWTRDLAALIRRLVAGQAPSGTYHGTSSGRTTWHGFAQAVVAAAGLDPKIVLPTASDDSLRAAARPAFSVLEHGALGRAGIAPIGPWDERWAVAAPSVLRPLGEAA